MQKVFSNKNILNKKSWIEHVFAYEWKEIV